MVITSHLETHMMCIGLTQEPTAKKRSQKKQFSISETRQELQMVFRIVWLRKKKMRWPKEISCREWAKIAEKMKRNRSSLKCTKIAITPKWDFCWATKKKPTIYSNADMCLRTLLLSQYYFKTLHNRQRKRECHGSSN